MKKILGLVLVIAVLVLGCYFGMGVVTERTLKTNIDVINQSNGVFIDIQQYHRGWFSSKADLDLHIHIPERLKKDQNGQSVVAPAQDYSVLVPMTILHGPMIFADAKVLFGMGYAKTDVQIPQQYHDQFNITFASSPDKPKLLISLFINYLNNSHLLFNVPAFTLTVKKTGDVFDWKGLQSEVAISSNLRAINGNLVINGAKMTKDKLVGLLGKINTEYKFQQTEDGLFLGDATLTLPFLSLTENTTTLFDIERLSLSSGSDVKEGLFSSYFKASFTKLTMQNTVYGPTEFEMAIKNLDAQVLAAINKESNKMQQGSDAERQQALLALLPELPKLFSKGAQFEISKLSLAMAGGPVNGDLLISLPAGSQGNPFQLLQKVEGHGKINAPIMVVNEIVKTAVRNNMQTQAGLPNVIAKQINADTKDNSAATTQAPTDQTATTSPDTSAKKEASSEVPAPGDATKMNKPMTAAQFEQEVTAQTSQKISALVQSGLLSLQGSKYVIEFNLSQGQLTVNGKPFSQSMIQF